MSTGLSELEAAALDREVARLVTALDDIKKPETVYILIAAVATEEGDQIRLRGRSVSHSHFGPDTNRWVRLMCAGVVESLAKEDS